MAKLTFYPVGNADTTLIEFSDDRLLLFDYCNQRDPDDTEDKSVILDEELRSTLSGKDREGLDVVAFSHSHDDHVHGAEEFFWFDHAKKYQDDDRFKINDLWVPACFVLEENLEGSARVIRQEARHRLRNNYGIHVFGNPGSLDDWFKEEGIDPDDRKGSIVHAGSLVSGFTQKNGGAEIFVHSPFSYQMEVDEEVVDKNNASILLHVTFYQGESTSKVFMGGDAEYQAWLDIIYITKKKKRTERLEWDAFGISHHCSYTALSDEKGEKKTEPLKEIKELFDNGESGCILVSSSNPVEDKDTKMPPHFQAANYYKDVAKDKSGKFLVTMETPTKKKPKPIEIEVTKKGLAQRKLSNAAAAGISVITRKTPELG